MSVVAEVGRAALALVILVAAVLALLWLAWDVLPSWDLRRRERRLDREALARFPDQAAVMAALRPKAPCGCSADWAVGPPSAMGCSVHSWPGGVFATSYPPQDIIVAWRARDLLRRKGLWS